MPDGDGFGVIRVEWEEKVPKLYKADRQPQAAVRTRGILSREVRCKSCGTEFRATPSRSGGIPGQFLRTPGHVTVMCSGCRQQSELSDSELSQA